MNRGNGLLCSLFCVASIVNPALAVDTASSSKPTVTQEFTVPPLRMTYGDLDSLLVGVRRLVEKANTGISPNATRVTLSMSAGETTVSINGWASLLDTHGLPNVSRKVWFDYVVSTSGTEPVVEVRFLLEDYSRTVTVIGSDTAQVEAIAEFIRRHFGQLTTLSGGFGFRVIGFFLLVIVMSPFSTILVPGLLYRFVPALRRRVVTVQFAAPILTPLITVPIVMFALPWDEWLPGTAIYTGSASFIDRNANLIGALGTFLGVASVVVGVIKWLSKPRRSDG